MAGGGLEVRGLAEQYGNLVAGIAAMTALAARIHSNSVLRVGFRARLLDAWRGAK